jgi:hypothetical protein
VDLLSFIKHVGGDWVTMLSIGVTKVDKGLLRLGICWGIVLLDRFGGCSSLYRVSSPILSIRPPLRPSTVPSICLSASALTTRVRFVDSTSYRSQSRSSLSIIATVAITIGFRFCIISHGQTGMANQPHATSGTGRTAALKCRFPSPVWRIIVQFGTHTPNILVKFRTWVNFYKLLI